MPLMVAVKSPQADRIEARGPDFIGGERGHDIGFGFSHQLMERDELEAAGASAFDDERESEDGALAIATAVVHENDVAAML